jgi:hypothetical protein
MTDHLQPEQHIRWSQLIHGMPEKVRVEPSLEGEGKETHLRRVACVGLPNGASNGWIEFEDHPMFVRCGILLPPVWG